MMFDPVWKLALGFITGIVFGVLLQKGQVAKFRVIVGQFLLRDWTVVKIMGTAVVVGSIGVYALLPTAAVSLHVKPLLWWGVVVGGCCFGVGMALFGYCPGTSVAACGEGRRDAMVGVLGMFVGATAYVLGYPQISQWVQNGPNSGELTLPTWTGTSPWLWISGLSLVALAIFVALEIRSRRAKRRADGD